MPEGEYKCLVLCPVPEDLQSMPTTITVPLTADHMQVQLKQAEDDVLWRVVGRGKDAQAGTVIWSDVALYQRPQLARATTDSDLRMQRRILRC